MAPRRFSQPSTSSSHNRALGPRHEIPCMLLKFPAPAVPGQISLQLGPALCVCSSLLSSPACRAPFVPVSRALASPELPCARLDLLPPRRSAVRTASSRTAPPTRAPPSSLCPWFFPLRSQPSKLPTLAPDLPWLYAPSQLCPLFGVFAPVEPAQPPFFPSLDLPARLAPPAPWFSARLAGHGGYACLLAVDGSAQATVAPREMVRVPAPGFRFRRADLCSVLAIFSASDLWRRRKLVSHYCLVHASTRSWSRRPNSPTFYYQFDYHRCCVRSRSLSPGRPRRQASPCRSSFFAQQGFILSAALQVRVLGGLAPPCRVRSSMLSTREDTGSR
ncbi:uncharacterized protein [Zea mays]|jgi:hypothetical protein|uniref:Uncharacterized protein n=1 Tax=Zea mays TaxID=4577 RepID=A0A804UDA2_MAIZE|nr:uncharacterized protein LOC103632383 [Zea mays]|eukprot:XP_008652443.1 uncharacterized protein LOC103632383 [Zea mays]